MPSTSSSPVGAVALGGGSQVICSFPSFLAGAMAVQVGADLGFGVSGLGLAVGLYHASAAAGAIPFGRMVDRIGAKAAIRYAAAGAIASTLGVALIADNLATFTVFLMLAGVSRAMAQPGANRLLLVRVRPGFLATAFGVKQSAPPIASMLAGLAVPTIALTVGWRWAYLIGAAMAAAVLLAARQRVRTDRATRKPPSTARIENRPTVALLGIAFSFSLAVAAIVGSFYVTSAVDAGTSLPVAGWVFASASLAAVSTRLVAGVACDRMEIDPLKLSSTLMGIGVFGLLLLASGRPTLMTGGVLLAMGGAWGFAGIFWFAMVRAHPDMPGRITGALAPASIGGVVGPIAFGMLADNLGFTAGWYFTAFLALTGTVLLRIGGRRLAAET